MQSFSINLLGLIFPEGKVFEVRSEKESLGLIMNEIDFVSVMKDSDLAEGKMRAVRVKGKPVLLARVSNEIYAIANLCPHAGCSLQGGILSGYLIMCPCHGWKFDVRNGQYEENPQTKLESYKLKIENGKIFIQIKR